MKRLNVKLLIIVAVTFVVLSLGVYSVHALQTSRNVGYLLDLAKESEQAGDLGQAVNFYFRYLQYRPTDTEQMANYALTFLRLAESPNAGPNDLGKAYGALNEAVQKLLTDDPAKRLPEVRAKLVDLLIRHGQYIQAEPYLVRMKAENTAAGKDDPVIDLQLAKCHIRGFKHAEAAKLLEPLLGFDRSAKKFDNAKATAPKEIEAYALLAVLYRDRFKDPELANRLELADLVIEQLAKANPDNPRAILVQAEDVMRRSPEKAQELVDRALAVAPNNADVVLMAANMAINAKDLAKAEKLLKDGLKENPKDNRIHSTLVQIVMRENRLEEAETLIRDGLNKLPNDPSLLEARFLLQILKKDFVAAKNTLELLNTSQIPPALRELLECRWLLMRGDYSAARKRLEALRPKTVGNKDFLRQADAMLLDVYRMLGLHDLVAEQAKLLGNENYLQARLTHAQTLVAQGKSDEALEVFEEIASRLNPEQLAKMQNVWRPLYELRIAQQQRKSKEARDWQKIDALLKLLREQQALPEPNLSLVDVDVLVRKGESDQAQRKLEQLAKQFPSDPSLLAATARLLAQQKGKSADAMQLLDKLGPDMQRDPVLISTRIECMLAGDATPAEKIQQLSKLGDAAAGWPEDAKFQAYSSLGIAMIQLQDVAAAQRWFGKATELHPTDSRLRWMMFDLARSANDLPGIKEAGNWFSSNLGPNDAQTKMIEAFGLVTAVRIALQGTVAPNQNEIVLDSNQRELLKKARNTLNEIKNQRSEWHEIPKLLAEVNILEGHLDEAITNLTEALDLGPANGRMIQQLVTLHYAKNNYAEAKEVLTKYASLVGEDMRRLEEELNRKVGAKIAYTDEQIDKLVDKNSTKISDLMYRANLFANAGKTDEAEGTYRKAVAIAPDVPEVWLALVDHLAKQKKGLEAHEVVQEAQIQLPEDRRALTLAQGYQALGDVGLADQFYLSALDAAPDDVSVQRAVATHYLRTQRVAKARPYLDKIISTPATAAAQNDNFGWARRESARLLAAEQDYQQFLKAMDLLKPVKGVTPDPQDLSLKAALLSERSEPASARQALQLLKTLSDQRPLVTLERLLRAQVQERLGNWTAANSEMTALISQAKPSPAIFVAYVDMLLRNDNAMEAKRWLDNLKSIAPDAPQIPILSARVDAALGRGAQAAANLKKELPAKRPLPKEEWRHLLQIAGLLEEIKQYDEAEKLLREFVGYLPQESLILAKFLADHGKVDETFTMVEQLRNNVQPTPLLQILLAAMRQKVAPPTKQQIERAEAFFARALRDDPESSLIQIQYAGLREFQHRYDEAEKLYRDIFVRSETRPMDRAVVANNLSYILAIQGKQLDEAMKFAKISMDFMGPQSDILDTRGLIFLAQGKFKEAVADLMEATLNPADPNRATKLLHLAMAQAGAKDDAKARETLRKAHELKLNPDDLPPAERAKYDALLRQLGQQA